MLMFPSKELNVKDIKKMFLSKNLKVKNFKILKDVPVVGEPFARVI